MKFLRYLLPFVFAMSLVSISSYANEGDRYEEELNERDFDALRQFVNSKRTLDLKEKSCNLTISGDVRTEWRHMTEKCNGRRILGNRFILDDKCAPLGNNDFDVEFNLRLDYISDNAWGVAHVLYDCAAGVDGGNCKRRQRQCLGRVRENENCSGQPSALFINGDFVPGSVLCCTDKFDGDPAGWHGSGSKCDLNLRKAYMGMNVYDNCGTRFDVEIGRRNLYNVFDSKVQFLSRFDGILLKYTTFFEDMADFYVYLAGFVVDERVNHFAWITELGVENIYDSCVDLKYSFIDWPKRGKNRCNIRSPEGCRFQNSQVSTAYHFNPEFINVKSKVYGAFIVNHVASKLTVRDIDGIDEEGSPIFGKTYNFDNERYAWYVGCTFGKVCEQGDWALDCQYQWVQAVAIPDRDCSGIGRGNFLGQSFTADGRGNTNFKGWRAELLYALTDNLTLDIIMESSTALNKRIGGNHDFSKFELEAIYAF